MNQHTIHLGMCSGALLATIGLAAEPTHFVPSHTVLLTYQSDNAVPITQAELWLSRDAGRSWQLARTVQKPDGDVRYQTEDDGRHDFYLVLRNEAGASASPPQPGSRPTVSVVVDTTPPLLQIDGHRLITDTNRRTAALFRITLVEEHLAPEALRVFYQEADAWVDGGPAALQEDEVRWMLPDELQLPAEILVIATDRAGNRATAGARLAQSTTAPAISHSTTQATSAPASAPALATPVSPVTIGPVEPVAFEPFTQAAPGAADESHTTSQLLPSQNLAQLRELATRFMAEGRYDLAAARLQDALDVDPQDPDLLVDYGSALYRVGQYEDATARFNAALERAPQHVGALEGLALVAATQKRYPDARDHMNRLRALLPQSGNAWLRSGDIEYRLGNATAALEHWRRVLAVEDADEDLRAKARRRLDYFSAPHGPAASPAAVNTDTQWHAPSHLRPSSSSAETTTTASPPS